MRLLSALFVLVACGPAPTLMDFHRTTLDPLARGQMDCPLEQLTFVDTTPDDMHRVANDPETRRYTVRGCEREAAYVCFTNRRTDTSERPECRPLRQRGDGTIGGVFIGPMRVD
ncbi:MAG: hypothetical protein AAGE52_20780 [Myxococcota bacterium]